MKPVEETATLSLPFLESATKIFFTSPLSISSSSIKNTRSALADSLNCPALTIETSSRCWKRWLMSVDSRFAQGHTKSAKRAMMIMRGVANCRMGRIKLVILKPLANHTIISESLYQRTKTMRVATNRETVSKTARYPRVASAIKTTASSGLTAPLAAKPKIRMTKVVTMMVTKTKKTPPVVKLSSRRRAW